MTGSFHKLAHVVRHHKREALEFLLIAAFWVPILLAIRYVERFLS